MRNGGNIIKKREWGNEERERNGELIMKKRGIGEWGE